MNRKQRNERLENQLKEVAKIYKEHITGLSEDFWSSVEEYIDDADWFMYFIVGYGVSRFYVIDSVLNYYWQLTK